MNGVDLIAPLPRIAAVDDALLSGVVMDHAVPLVCDFLTASVGSSGNG